MALTPPTQAPTNSYFRGKTPEPVVIHHVNSSNQVVPAQLADPTLATSGTYDQVDVDEAGTLLLAANPSRKGLLLRNTGADTVYWGLSDTVLATTGQPLDLDESIYPSHLSGYGGPIYAITGAGDTATVAVTEW